MKFLMAGAIALMATSAAHAAQPAAGKAEDVAVSQKYVYYDVQGDTANAIRTQMNKNGTKWDDGRTYDSVTSWNFKWNYTCSCANNTCRAADFKTDVDITFRFPKWVKSADAPTDLVTRWDTYMQHLTTHENGHRDMAVAAAEKLCRDVRGLTSTSPEDLDRKIASLTAADMNKLNTDEKQYDVSTIHGTTQGAVFP